MDHIEDREILYRSVEDENCYADGSKIRLKSQAFADRHKKPSVDRAKLWDFNPTKTQLSPSDAIVMLFAEQVRSLKIPQYNSDKKVEFHYEMDVHAAPIPEESGKPANPAHAEIRPNCDFRSDKAFKRLLESLCRLAEGYYLPILPESQRPQSK